MNEPDCTEQKQWELYRNARERIRELEAIIAKLPKDADGDLLEPNRSYWFTSHGDLMRGAYTINAIEVNDIRAPTSNFAPNVPGAYHKTREAAEAAREKK